MAISQNTTKPGEYSNLELVCIFHVSEEEIRLLKAQGMTSAEIAERQRQLFKDGTLVEPEVTYSKVSSLREALCPGSDASSSDNPGFEVWVQEPVVRQVAYHEVGNIMDQMRAFAKANLSKR